MNQAQMEHEFPISKYMVQKAAALGIPITGSFELTSRCNFNCKMCYVHEMNDQEKLIKEELSVEDWLKIAEEAKKAGLLFLLLTGGEAMLRKDFLELYERLAGMGFRLVINSNGSMLTEEVLECFRKYPPARVNISLYGASEDTYEKLCENRSFQKVRNAIRSLKKEGISVRNVMMLTSYNVDDMEAVFKISREEDTMCEMSSYLFPPVRREDGRCGKNMARLSAEEAGRYMVKRERLLLGEESFLKRTESIEWLPELDEDDREVEEGSPVRCQAGSSSFWITWDGKMRPCGLMTGPQEDVRKEGFLNAWEKIHKEAMKIRLPKECVTCKNKSICQGCAAVCQAETGYFDRKPEYVCEMVEAQREAYKEQRKEIIGK